MAIQKISQTDFLKVIENIEIKEVNNTISISKEDFILLLTNVYDEGLQWMNEHTTTGMMNAFCGEDLIQIVEEKIK